jgi:tRNA pseudouridine55 synthase
VTLSGYLNVDKPLGMTSHDVVGWVRRHLREPDGAKLSKVGHAGTLDPLATGVLVVCIGTATRLSEYVMDSTKRYRARVRLGVTTDTYDAAGEILARCDASQITQNDVEAVLPRFIGNIQQIPPMYSAIKQGGRKLYDLARAGETVERPPRPVRIDSLTISDFGLFADDQSSGWDFTLDVTCSAGTYIRSLAFDIGEVLGVGAHLAALTRTASGSFVLEKAVTLEALPADDWTRYLLPPDAPLNAWPAIRLSAEDALRVRQGQSVREHPSEADAQLARAYAPDGQFMALLRADTGVWKPHKVFVE